MAINLNANQERAVTYDGKDPLIIEAGPGSGKTRVLTERVKFLLNEKKVDPESLLVITFTRKATEELKHRLSEDISSEVINKMQISTIHGFCFDLLKKYDNFDFEILDDDYGQKKTLFIQKYKDYLGFRGEGYVSGSGIGDVVDKFGEYATFKVNSDKLIGYIRENRPIGEDFKQLIREHALEGFPYDEVNADKDLKGSWYNGKYLQIASAYQRYLNLLEEKYLVDYDTLQIKALDFLKENPDTAYKNVLIDEFQDTNPVQYYLFEILLKGAESFTVVGDVDQSIYGFRGASSDYLMDLARDYSGHLISLNENYRSTDNVVGLTEEFIRPTRSEDSKKSMVNVREFESDNYYIVGDGKEEASRIVESVKRLKGEGKIQNYNDIAILFRSLKGSTAEKLVDLLEEEGIPFEIRNHSSLYANDDVKSLITLLHYILPDQENSYLSYKYNKFEREWLSLRAFAGDSFEPTLWQLSDETKALLNEMQDEFEEKALAAIKEIYKRDVGKAAKITTFKGIFGKNSVFAKNRTDDMLEEMFERVPKPKIDLDLIENADDREFFQKLEDLKLNVSKNIGYKLSVLLERIKNKSRKQLDLEYISSRLEYGRNLASKNRELTELGLIDRLDNLMKLARDNVAPDAFLDEIDNAIAFVDENSDTKTVLDFFYDILRITRYFDSADEKSLKNFSAISESIYNFESIMSKDDLPGFFRFLQTNIEKWTGTPVSDSKGVQIMTIHKSKGLEFPVVIVPSIGKDKFPKKFQDPREKDHIYGKPTYFTPSDCLDYKTRTDDEEEEFHNLEELRILYVAITRAQDSVLLSFIDEVHPLFEGLADSGFILPFEGSDICKCESVYSHDELDVLNASYTSIKSYDDCPFRYQLLHDLKFKVSENDAIRMGSAVHNAFNKINIEKIRNPDAGDEEINSIIEDIFESTPNISKDKDALEEFRDNIHSFYEAIGDVEILESEYAFSITRNGHNISGSIDLIYKKDDDIYIIDYKNSTADSDDKINYYTDQLKLYLYALSTDSRYENMNINKAGIYFVKSQKTVTKEFSEDEIGEYVDKMNGIIEKIKNKEFDEKAKSNYCPNCVFNFICTS